MSFRVGDKVRINLPEGANFFGRKTADGKAESLDNEVGTVIAIAAVNGEAQYTVEVPGHRPYRVFGRDLVITAIQQDMGVDTGVIGSGEEEKPQE